MIYSAAGKADPLGERGPGDGRWRASLGAFKAAEIGAKPNTHPAETARSRSSARPGRCVMAKCLVCGEAFEDHHVLPREHPVECPDCRSGVHLGYGLAAGGIGTYAWCPRCERFLSFVPDEGV